jgi:hypothetical protein
MELLAWISLTSLSGAGFVADGPSLGRREIAADTLKRVWMA